MSAFFLLMSQYCCIAGVSGFSVFLSSTRIVVLSKPSSLGLRPAASLRFRMKSLDTSFSAGPSSKLSSASASASRACRGLAAFAAIAASMISVAEEEPAPELLLDDASGVDTGRGAAEAPAGLLLEPVALALALALAGGLAALAGGFLRFLEACSSSLSLSSDSDSSSSDSSSSSSSSRKSSSSPASSSGVLATACLRARALGADKGSSSSLPDGVTHTARRLRSAPASGAVRLGGAASAGAAVEEAAAAAGRAAASLGLDGAAAAAAAAAAALSAVACEGAADCISGCSWRGCTSCDDEAGAAAAGAAASFGLDSVLGVELLGATLGVKKPLSDIWVPLAGGGFDFDAIAPRISHRRRCLRSARPSERERRSRAS